MFRTDSPRPGQGEIRLLLRRLLVLNGLIVFFLVVGSVGFALAEDVSVWRGAYWALDVVATTGSVSEPDSLGGQLVKVLLIILGLGTVFFALVTVTEFIVEGHLAGLLARRTLRHIADFRDHIVICGFGRVGRQVARDLRADGDEFVVVDSLPENRELASSLDVPFLLGTPSDDEMLREAGVEHARSVIACVDSDAENIFICLTARELAGSDVTVVARAAAEDSEKKLLRAGADRVISPYKTSGAEMARLALQPQVSGVVDVAPEYRMEEIEVTPGCEGAGKRIGEVRGGATIAALRRAGGQVEPQPAAETELQVGDVLVAMGTVEALHRLEELFKPAR